MHGNARSSPLGRLGMVLRVIEEGEPVAQVARGMGMYRQCVSKWVRRYREEGRAGLEDRSYRPKCSPMRTSPEVEELVLRARRVLRAGPGRLSAFTGVPERTISRILRRHGMLRLWECDPLTGKPLKSPPGPVIRYERDRPGELLHMDVKKLSSIPPGGGWKIHGRGKAPAGGAGWTFVHSVVDDYTRLAYSEPLPDEKGTTVAAFTARALNHFHRLGITHITEIMTDNHWSYTHSRAFASLLAQHGIRHITIKPYHPQQNGKVERYNQTLKREWANSQPWPDNQTRNQALRHWLHYYNNHRPHYSLGGKPPTSRL